MISLVLEASTYVGSVALLRGATLLGDRTVAMRGREHEALMPAVAELLSACAIDVGRLERVVCGAGPGSFTSLRIGGAIAKGIALAVNIPLVPVSSLALLVGSAVPLRPARYLAAVDAMRGEHYVQCYEIRADGAIDALGSVTLVASDQVDPLASTYGAIAIGPDRPGDALVTPHARAAAYITNIIDRTAPAELAGWEPGYGRLAEAQVKWEAANGRPLPAA